MNREDLDKLLTYAVKKEASDIHISVGACPVFRINGKLRRVEGTTLTQAAVRGLLENILNEGQREMLTQAQEIDFAYHVEHVARFRTNVYHQLRGDAIAFRVIPEHVRTLDDLKAPKSLYTLSRELRGLVLVTGPTGSGKSTTLAGMIDLINAERSDHIITIEDPIEYVHQNKNCLINQRELGEHTNSFASALRAALREDPDVILVGEMRDLETISLALTAAETGHLVFATLHTNSAAETVNRIVDVFPGEQQGQIRAMFANSVQGVIAQRLLPTAAGTGRIAAMEVMTATSAIRNLIREQKTHQIPSAIQTGATHGMQSMDQALRTLYVQGTISRELAMANAADLRTVLAER